MTPLCSVLTPTRNYTEGLLKAIDSVRNTSSPERVEHLVWVDDDDEATLRIVPSLEDAGIRVVIGPRGMGYSDTGRFVTELAKQARGDWIVVLEDDATFEQSDPYGAMWDHQLEYEPKWGVYMEPECYRLNHSEYSPASPICGFTPNRFWEKFGREQYPFPCDAASYRLLVAEQKWPVRIIRGMTYNHQRDEGRRR